MASQSSPYSFAVIFFFPVAIAFVFCLVHPLLRLRQGVYALRDTLEHILVFGAHWRSPFLIASLPMKWYNLIDRLPLVDTLEKGDIIMNLKISIRCEKCGCAFELRAKEFSSKEKLTCPNCGQDFDPVVFSHLKTGMVELSKVPYVIPPDADPLPFSSGPNPRFSMKMVSCDAD